MASPNTLFALFAVSNPAALEQKLRAGVPMLPIIDYKVAEGSWLLITSNAVVTRELSDLLGITDGTVSSGILVRVENYYGRANKEIWEWVVAKMDVPLGPPKVEAAIERQENA